MTEGSASGAPSTRRGVGPASSSGRRCICGGAGVGGGGCGLGLARLVGRLRRQGRRALCAPSAAAAARRRGCQCQYDPLSYARNFDLGGDDDGAASSYYIYSFSSRFVMAPSSSSASSVAAAVASAPSVLSSRPVVTSH